MNMRPLNDRVIVERVASETTTASGIIIPDSAKEKPQRGTIVAAGPKVDAVKAGDEVLFPVYAGNEFQSTGSDFIVMREEEILAIVE
ncbi:MAG: co-chaperone GroES [Desulfovibrio sp.]